jgi:hypothetical protein
MRNRTLGLIGVGLLVAALTLGGLSAALAQAVPAPGWGPGGMMVEGPMSGSTMGGWTMGSRGMLGGTWQRTATPLGSLEDARQAFQAYLDRIGNSDLVLDEVMAFERNYYAIVKERSTGGGAFELLADPRTGAVFPEYGPTMMWNARYGHMASGMMDGGMMGGRVAAGGPATVGPGRARAIAQEWLDAYQAGSAIEAPDAFPGYYTLHVVRDGQVTGMLSVNAASGQVWYHGWHGAFVAEAEAGH